MLWLIKGLGPGGAEQLLASAASVRDQEQYAYEVAYLLPWKNHLVRRLQDLGVPVHCLGARNERALGWAVTLRRLLQARAFDVLHVHSPYVAGVARLVVQTLPGSERPALASTEHNLWSSFSVPTRMLNAWTSRLDEVRFAVSNGVRGSMSARSRASVEVIVHGVDIAAVRAASAKREETRRALEVRSGEVLIGTVGNFRAQKAYPDLLAAARRVLDEGHPVRFVAVGQGPLEAEIKQVHAELGLDERFCLFGYHPNPPEIMAGCDIFVLASEYEGLSVALMEALVLGLPVIATDVEGIFDAMTHGVEGLLVPPHRPDLFAARLAEMAADSDQRERMGAAATVRGEEFDIHKAVRRVEAHYRRLAGPGGRRDGRDEASSHPPQIPR